MIIFIEIYPDFDLVCIRKEVKEISSKESRDIFNCLNNL